MLAILILFSVPCFIYGILKKMTIKEIILSLYNQLFPLIIAICSLSSILKYGLWQGILLFFNFIIFLLIFAWNSQEIKNNQQNSQENNDDLN